MKAIKYILCAAMVAAMTACGVSNRHDKVTDLLDDREEWTADQTNEAIDIYIEGLKDQAALYEKYSLIGEKINLEGDWERKAKKSSYWKGRKQEIKDAQKKLKEKTKELREKYED